jgi:phage shock protein A
LLKKRVEEFQRHMTLEATKRNDAHIKELESQVSLLRGRLVELEEKYKQSKSLLLTETERTQNVLNDYKAMAKLFVVTDNKDNTKLNDYMANKIIQLEEKLNQMRGSHGPGSEGVQHDLGESGDMVVYSATDGQ